MLVHETFCIFLMECSGGETYSFMYINKSRNSFVSVSSDRK